MLGDKRGSRNFSVAVKHDDNMSPERIKEVAEKEFNASRSTLIIEATKFLINLGPSFLGMVYEWSEVLGIPHDVFVKNIVLDWVARLAAKREVDGPQDEVLSEFMITGRGVVTDEEFYNYRKELYVRAMETEKAHSAYRKRERGEEISEEEEGLIRKYLIGGDGNEKENKRIIEIFDRFKTGEIDKDRLYGELEQVFKIEKQPV